MCNQTVKLDLSSCILVVRSARRKVLCEIDFCPVKSSLAASFPFMLLVFWFCVCIFQFLLIFTVEVLGLAAWLCGITKNRHKILL